MELTHVHVKGTLHGGSLEITLTAPLSTFIIVSQEIGHFFR